MGASSQHINLNYVCLSMQKILFVLERSRQLKQVFIILNVFGVLRCTYRNWDQGRSQGGKGGKSPPKPKKLLQKTGVISQCSIFSNKFSKNKIKNKIKNKNKIKIQFFNRIIIKDFQNFLKISQQFAFFVQTRKKLTTGQLNFLKNMQK